jgi:hypothetical protein
MIEKEAAKEKKKDSNKTVVREVMNNAAEDTIYLCNFRVSVDGDWLCLKELGDSVGRGGEGGGVKSMNGQQQKKRKDFPTTPEFEQMVRYPNYPVGRTG